MALLLVFSWTLIPTLTAHAVTTIVSPSSNTGGNWISPTYAYADGDTAATIISGSPSGSNIWGDFGLSTTEAITSVKVRYDAWDNGGGTGITYTNSPSANTGGSWTNPDRAYDNGGTGYASITSGTPSGNNIWGNYGFSTPDAIDRVRVGYDAWSSGVSANQQKVPTGDGITLGTYTLARSISPTANGVNLNTWTPSTGTLWECVNDINLQDSGGDSDYITSPTTSGSYQFFTYATPNIPSSATSISITVYERSKRNGSGTSYIQEGIRVNGSNYYGTIHTPYNGTWYAYGSTWSTNPGHGGAVWTVADVNGSSSWPLQQIGIYSTDWNPSVTTSVIIMEISYTYASNAYQAVDETSPDDTDYMKGTTDGTSYYHFTFSAFSIPTNSTITNLTVYYRARDAWNATPGTNIVRAGLRVNSANYDATATTSNPGSTYTTYSYAFTQNPNTASTWTVDDINGSGAHPLQQFGIASSDGAPDFDVSMVYAQVNYTEYDDQIGVAVSWDGGSSWSSNSTQTLTSSETTYWYDVTSATTWTGTKLNDTNLKVRADAYTANSAEVINLDWIPVEVKTSPQHENIRVDVSWDGGGTWSSQQSTQVTSTEAAYWYDVTTVTTWTTAKLSDANFKVRVDTQSIGDSDTVSLDWLAVEVIYTTVQSGTANQNIIMQPGSDTQIETLAVTPISQEWAIANGNVTAVMGTYATRGFKYGLTETDTWDWHEDGLWNSTGTFSGNLTGLIGCTQYSVRAYTVTNAVTRYGGWMSFTTLVDIADTPSAVNFGIVLASSIYWSHGNLTEPGFPLEDGNCTFTLTNEGSCTIDIAASAGNMTGGVTYALISGAPGENEFRFTLLKSGAGNSTDGLVLTEEDQSFHTDLVASSTLYWELKFETWSSNTDGAIKTTTITLTGSAS